MNSIEWLIEKLGWNNRSDAINRIVDEAKEMHKQEIIDAYIKGREEHYLDWYPQKHSEEYYQETFVSKGSDFKQFSLYEHKETITSADTPVSNSFLNSTSSQPQLYTEEQLKLAYMQGYNRGKDGNPNHMESYIEFIKQPKKD